MSQKQILNLSGKILQMAFILPAIIFWGIFCYSGYSLSGFLTFTAFIMHGYQVADMEARHVFELWLIYFYFGFLSIILMMMWFLGAAPEEDNSKENKIN